VVPVFLWTELLLFFEFKLIYKQLLEGLVRDAVTQEIAARVRLVIGFSDPSIISLSIYDSCRSVHIELSGRSTTFTIYISQTEYVTQGARSSHHDHPLCVSPITHVGFGVKAQL
jgi:hypothetical protein